MNTLALQVQQGLGRDPHAGEIFCFRGRKGDLVKILWHDGVGTSLYLKRLEAGKFTDSTLAQVWHGAVQDDFATAIITSTAALTLSALGVTDATRTAADLWQRRHRAEAA